MTDTEDRSAIERQLWASEKAVCRAASPDDMRWVLQQAGDDYAIAEKYLDAWDACVSAGISPFFLIAAMARQRRVSPGVAPRHVSRPSYQVSISVCRFDGSLAICLAMYIALEWCFLSNPQGGK